MSWSMLVTPLHHAALTDGVLEWAATASFSHGVPDRVPASQRLPLVADVLAAFRSAGCHGTAWFTVEDQDTAAWLPSCPNPAECVAVGGMDVGEVSLRTVDQKKDVRTDTAVE